MAGYSAPALKIRPMGAILPCMAAARFAAVLLFVLSTTLCAQDRPTSQLVVTIVDTSGAVVPGARIGVISLPTTTQGESGLLQSALHSPELVWTNADGAGEATVSLTNGQYVVVVTASGFERYLEKLEVRDESIRSVRIVLKINPENVRGDCMACAQVIPVEPMVLNALIPLEPCHSQDSNDQKLEVLNQPLDRSNHEAVECAFTLMDDLSRTGDQRVLPVLIRNLDLEQPDDLPSFNPQRHPFWDYPAMLDLIYFEEKAEPLLLDVIARAAPLWSQRTENATAALMSNPRRDRTEGIRILLRRADQERGQAAVNLREAAKYAVSLCGYEKQQACEDMIWPKRLRTLSHPAPK